jgi:hypothetical protein
MRAFSSFLSPVPTLSTWPEPAPPLASPCLKPMPCPEPARSPHLRSFGTDAGPDFRRTGLPRRSCLWLAGALLVLGVAGCGPSGDSATPPRAASAPAAVRPVLELAYESQPIGLPLPARPVIPHLAIADLDADGLEDVIVCDGVTQRIGWIRQAPRGVFTETAIGDPVPGPGTRVCVRFHR